MCDAWHSLAPQGQALIVANRQLPYEQQCSALVSGQGSATICAENEQFKVLLLKRD